MRPVSAGQTAQFQLQLTPGTGYSGTVSLACGGAPFGAVCQVPPTVSIPNGTPALFSATVSTAGSAVLPPSVPWRFSPPARFHMLLPLVFVLLLATIGNRWMSDSAFRARRLVSCGALATALLCSVLYVAACGSATSPTTTTPTPPTPPPVITPSGTSTITITLSAMSPTQQPLQLPPIQLTLTVK